MKNEIRFVSMTSVYFPEIDSVKIATLTRNTVLEFIDVDIMT